VRGHSQIIFVIARYTDRGRGARRRRKRRNKINKRRVASERGARSAIGLSRIGVR
jgi:hypothetical protein